MFQKILTIIAIPVLIEIMVVEESKYCALMVIASILSVFYLCNNVFLKAARNSVDLLY